MTVYRRPDPIPLRRAPATTSASTIAAVRTETDDLNRLVAREIFLAIASGRFPAGSILPNEHQLAADLGVSRTALREAIKGLASKGMVETRRKRGTQVLDRSRWNMLDAEVISWSRRSGTARVSDELRASLSVVLPALASAAATSAHCRTAIDAVDRYRAELTREAFAAMLCDLAVAGDNRFLASVVSSAVHSLVVEDAQNFDQLKASFAASELARLSEALRSRNSALAATVIRSAFAGDAKVTAVAHA